MVHEFSRYRANVASAEPSGPINMREFSTALIRLPRFVIVLSGKPGRPTDWRMDSRSHVAGRQTHCEDRPNPRIRREPESSLCYLRPAL